MTTSTYSPFLDILPPELRQQIYSYLLVSPKPIKGPLARGHTKYSIHTSILRTCTQINTEARPIFFGRNTFSITSIPPCTTTEDDDGSGAFEPPLQLKDLPLVRHLEVDMLFYPKVLRMLEGKRYGGWKPVCPAAERYVGSLVALMGAVEHSLVSLTLCADTRRYAQVACEEQKSTSSSSSSSSSLSTSPLQSESDSQLSKFSHTDSTTSSTTPTPPSHSSEDDEVLDLKKILTGFHMADRNPRFRDALSKLRVEKMHLHFDFSESYFDFAVDREVLCSQRFAELAGQILIKRNDIRRDAALRDLDETYEEEQGLQDRGRCELESRAY